MLYIKCHVHHCRYRMSNQLGNEIRVNSGHRGEQCYLIRRDITEYLCLSALFVCTGDRWCDSALEWNRMSQKVDTHMDTENDTQKERVIKVRCLGRHFTVTAFHCQNMLPITTDEYLKAHWSWAQAQIAQQQADQHYICNIFYFFQRWRLSSFLCFWYL